MKILLIWLVFCLFSIKSYSTDDTWYNLDSPEYLTSQTGFSSNDQSYAGTTDSEGNLIIAGYFEGKMNFGNRQIISNGDKDLFVAKRDNEGNWLWAINAGGKSSDYAYGVTTDSDDNVYITGYFYDKVRFGNYEIESSGVSDIYVASLSSSGEWRWAVNAGGSSFDKGIAIATDNSSNVYAAGVFQSSADFGTETHISKGRRDIFIAKLDSDGNWINSVSLGSSGQDEIMDIKISDNNDVVIGGFFNSSITIGSDTLISAGQDDGFIAIANDDIVFSAANRFGSSAKDALNTLTIAGTAIYATGYFSGTADFDEFEIISEGGRDIFVAEMNMNAELLQIISAGGNEDDEGESLIYENNNIFVTGYFRSDADFAELSISSDGQSDIFLAKINSDFEWDNINTGGGTSVDLPVEILKSESNLYVISNFFRTTQFGTYSNESAGGYDILISQASKTSLTWNASENYYGFQDFAESRSINKDIMGNKYITGSFYGQLTFGSNILNAQKSSDGFIAKSGPAGNYIWAKTIKTDSDATIFSVDTDDELNVYVCGSFSGNAQFGNIEKSSNGLKDIFVAKLDKDGNWLWVNIAGNFYDDEAYDIAYYDDNNIYLTGYYSFNVDFGDISLSGSTASRIFAANVDSEGNWVWANRAGGNGYDIGYAVAADSSGNCLVTGIFEGDASFGDDDIVSYGNDDFFISKLNSDGEWIWTNSSGSNTWKDAAYDIQADADGNVYLTGQFNNFATFDDSYLISKGDVDAFIVQLDSNGEWGFLTSLGGKSFDTGTSLYYNNNELYFTGTFSDTLIAGNQEYYALNEKDVFFGKIDISDGSFDWIKTAGSSENAVATGVSGDERGNLHFTGNFSDSISLDNLILTNNTKVDRNFFVASYGNKTPPYQWNHKKNTGAFAEVIIPDSINPMINGDNFSEYDAVGIYYKKDNEKIFGGFAHWNNETLTIKIWQDDETTNLQDGFITDSTYKYELWDYETEKVFSTSVYYSGGSGTFSENAESVIRYLPKPEEDSITVSLNPGWNFISAYVIPFDEKIEDIISEAEEDIVIVKDGHKFYIPKYSIKTMDDWYHKNAYKVFARAETEFEIKGFYFPNTSGSLQLKEGWNMVPYLSKNAMQITYVFESLTDDNILIIAKDDEGNIFLPIIGINEIGEMNPGEAYYIYVTQDIEFVFPSQ